MERIPHQRFSIAGGTVPGTDHTKPGEPFWRNNNDAYVFAQNDDYAVAIVCDGCGSSLSSEVGAHIISRMLLQLVTQEHDLIDQLPVGISRAEPEVFVSIRSRLLHYVKALARHMGTSVSHMIKDYFLATVIGYIATREKLVAFSIGDGYIVVNGVVQQLLPSADNEPPYVAYGITGAKFAEKDSQMFAFSVETRNVADVDTVLIATDGIECMINNQNTILPGIGSPVGPLSQFWTEDRFFKNDDMVRRRLAQLNREIAVLDQGASHPRIQKGILRDDTTLVVMRKNIFPPLMTDS